MIKFGQQFDDFKGTKVMKLWVNFMFKKPFFLPIIQMGEIFN